MSISSNPITDRPNNTNSSNSSNLKPCNVTDSSILTTLQEHAFEVSSIVVATTLVATSAFVGYKMYQTRKALNIENAKKAQIAFEEAAKKEQIAKAMREAEAAKLKALKDACEAVEKVKNYNSTTLGSLGINFCHIPLAWPEGAETLGYGETFVQKADVAPIFKRDKEIEVQEIKAQIEESLKSGGTVPLPNLRISGPPGVGKTHLISNFCKTLGIGYIKIPTGLLESRLTQGNSTETFQSIVKIAETSSVPVLVVLDDGEGLFAKDAAEFKMQKKEVLVDLPWYNPSDRTNSNDIISERRRELVQAILDYAQKPERKVGFALTTNRPDVIDDRFKEVTLALEIPPPEKNERMKILIQGLVRVFGEDHPVLGYFNSERVTALADKTEGFTGRNIIKMIETLYSFVSHKPHFITDAIINNAVELTIPSVEHYRLDPSGQYRLDPSLGG